MGWLFSPETVRTLFLHMGQYKPGFGRYPYDAAIAALAVLFVILLPWLVLRLGRSGLAGNARQPLMLAFFSGFFVFFLFWSLAFPLYQVPDEQSHFAYVQHIAELGTLPVCRMGTRTGVPPVIPAEYDVSLFFHQIIFKTDRTHPFTDGRFGVNEGRFSFPPSQRKETVLMGNMESCWKILSHHYPPLYYLGGAAAYRLVYYGTFFTRFWAVRMVSILLALSLLYACWRLARLLGKGGDDRGIRPWAAVALLGTFPMFSQVAVSISPNILEIGIQTVFIFILLKIVEDGIPLRLTVPFSLVIAAGLLTRQPLIGLFPLGVGAVLLEGRAHSAPAREIVKTLALMTGIIVVAAGWWYLWFYVIHGRFDFVAINFTAADTRAIQAFRRTPLDYLFCGQIFSFPIQSFWGSFAWRNIHLPETVANLFSVVALGGVGLYAARLILGSHAGGFDRRRAVWLLSVLIIYFVMIKAVGFSAFRYKGFEFLQGRHFFGMLGGGVAAVIYGYTGTLREQWAERICIAAIIGMGALNLYALFALIIPRFYH